MCRGTRGSPLAGEAPVDPQRALAGGGTARLRPRHPACTAAVPAGCCPGCARPGPAGLQGAAPWNMPDPAGEAESHSPGDVAVCSAVVVLLIYRSRKERGTPCMLAITPSSPRQWLHSLDLAPFDPNPICSRCCPSSPGLVARTHETRKGEGWKASVRVPVLQLLCCG